MLPVIPIYIIVTGSALWFTRDRIEKKHKLKEEQEKEKAEKEERESKHVSSRGIEQLKPIFSYLKSFFKCLEDPCHPTENPDGYIALCVAENKLIIEDLSNYISSIDVPQVAFTNQDHFCYNDFRGLPKTREVIANFLTRKFLYKSHHHVKSEPRNENCDTSSHDNETRRVRQEDVVIGSGAAGLINSLFFTICEAGEAVLIPAPYYAAFESDMKAIAKCVPFPVKMSQPALGPTTLELEAAARRAESKGLTVRTLLLTNPNNPLGVIYDKRVIRSCIEWSRGRSMHTIVDEIYALSVHTDKDDFESVISIMHNELGNDVHMLWALSKDFGSSGFRVGVLYSQNQTLIQALGNLNIFAGVSHPMQAIASSILSDDEFVDRFLESSQDQLRKSLNIVTQTLETLEIPFIRPSAGIFIYCDFSSMLPSQTFDGEAVFATLVEEVGRVVMTPGESQRDPKPGNFRICYAWVNEDVLRIAMSRLNAICVTIREQGWGNIQNIRIQNVGY